MECKKKNEKCGVCQQVGERKDKRKKKNVSGKKKRRNSMDNYIKCNCYLLLVIDVSDRP